MTLNVYSLEKGGTLMASKDVGEFDFGYTGKSFIMDCNDKTEFQIYVEVVEYGRTIAVARNRCAKGQYMFSCYSPNKQNSINRRVQSMFDKAFK